LIDPKERWYHGRPIMITVNDYQLELFNGDVGLVWADPEHDGQLRVFFAAEGGGMRSFSPFRLPRHETVYAMTVHKSQGSEFEQVALLLPDHDTPLISRELLYTAVTRARCSVALFTGRELFCTAVKRVVQRHSGLMERLWQTR
jgi:exodeoxyribonuclease V alpha subunit